MSMSIEKTYPSYIQALNAWELINKQLEIDQREYYDAQRSLARAKARVEKARPVFEETERREIELRQYLMSQGCSKGFFKDNLTFKRRIRRYAENQERN